MKTIGKYIILTCYFVLITSYINAQSIKDDIKQKKQQQQHENEQRKKKLEEEARIRKAQLKLNDLLQLLQSKDVDYVDGYLSKRGWKLHSTNVKGTTAYDEEITRDYNMAQWLFDKEWFYFYQYQTYDNAIAYTISDEAQLEGLKLELTNGNYQKASPTEVIQQGLESVYRNDVYEVNFKKQLKSSGGTSNYTFFIYNYKEIEEQKAEAERLAREAVEKENKYRDALQRAETAYKASQYTIAIQAYKDAIALKPENAELLYNKITDVNISIHCQNAENYFNNRQYAKAKEEYGKALSLKPDSNTVKGKIKEIDAFMLFLKERTYKQYDYTKIDISDYNAKNSYITEEMRKSLLANREILPKTNANIVFEIDTLGITVSEFSSSIQNNSLNTMLERINKSIKLNSCFINGYPVNAKAGFNYTVEHNHAIITVEKKARNIEVALLNDMHFVSEIVSNSRYFDIYKKNIIKELEPAPFGKYTFDMNKTIINEQEYSNYRLVKMKGTGGPSNALYSLLIPGLGDHRVTYGQKSGIKTTLLTYGFIGIGIGCKLHSNSEYKKYHEATLQIDMDEHYKAANDYNQAFYVCMGIGAVAWLYDIIWVWVKGAKNKKEYKAWEQSHLSLYSDPNLRATGFSYKIDF
ncbi:MAG: hypothetical protein LBG15_14275 [Dysgonamonadaceae bacterium]|jgi:hypothetical protein|nr:hypothetical protein [Dysgonamonadaceae bacterium]